MRRSAIALAALAAVAGRAVAEDLATFLQAATAASRPSSLLRADGELITTSPDGTQHDQLALLLRPNGDVYVELRMSGMRALIPASGAPRMVSGPGQSAAPMSLDTGIGGSEFTAEDLRPFTAAAYRSPTIIDRNGDEFTVSLTPREDSQYALLVVTFDGPKRAPLVVKRYKETISNLVRMQRDRGLTSIGGIWVPTAMSMENFPLRATSTMTLRWQTAADQPALFDPAALGKPSTLAWPEKTGS